MYLRFVLPAILAFAAFADFEELQGYIGFAGDITRCAGYILPAILISRLARQIVVGH